MIIQKLKFFPAKIKKMDKTYAINNCNVPCCNEKHFINFKDGKEVIPTFEFFNIIFQFHSDFSIVYKRKSAS